MVLFVFQFYPVSNFVMLSVLDLALIGMKWLIKEWSLRSVNHLEVLLRTLSKDRNTLQKDTLSNDRAPQNLNVEVFDFYQFRYTKLIAVKALMV